MLVCVACVWIMDGYLATVFFHILILTFHSGYVMQFHVHYPIGFALLNPLNLYRHFPSYHFQSNFCQYTLNILLYSFYQFTSSHSFFHPYKLSVAPHVVRVSHQPYSLVLQQRLRQMKLPSNRRSRENRDMLRNLWIGIVYINLYTYYIPHTL